MGRSWKKATVAVAATLGLASMAVLAGRPLWLRSMAAHNDHLWHLHGSASPPGSGSGRQATGPMFMDFLMGGPLAAEAARKVAAQVPAAPKTLQPRVTREGGATVREYTLEISEQVIDYGDGNAWTAWTYNGSVPGPTLRARPGETLRVKVRNRHNRVHSFHTPLSHYPIENDGSQANTITGKGSGAMIPPGTA